MSQKIPPKQLRFCQEYVIDLNATRAAIKAGYSEKTAQEQSSRLLSKAIIKAKIKQLQKKIGERLDISAEAVVRELALCGFSNIQDFIDNENAIRDLTTITRDKAAAVESVKTVETVVTIKEKSIVTKTTTARLHDKISALEKIGRHLGIFEKDNRQKETRIELINDIKPRKE